jgi:MOSC domain-containing protein YiiM
MKPYIDSLQIGRVQKLDGWESGSFKKEVDLIEVFLGGVNGDEVSDTKSHGGVEKAVFANSLQNYPLWQQFLGLNSLPKGALSENLTIDGLDEKSVFLGDIHHIGEVTLQVVQPRKPCWKISKRYDNKHFTKFIYETGTTGWYYKVLQGGKIQKKDTVTVSHNSSGTISILEANLAFKEPKKHHTLLKNILSLSNISESYKEGIAKRLQGQYSLAFMELPKKLNNKKGHNGTTR